MKRLITLLTALVLVAHVVSPTDINVSVDVAKAISVTFNYNSVSFGTLTQGTSDNHPTPDYTGGSYNVTIDTNYAWQSKASGTDFSDGAGHSFSIGNLKVDTNETLGNLNPAISLTGTPQVIGTSSTTGTGIIDYHAYTLTIPSNQYSASYTATVTWTYENQ